MDREADFPMHDSATSIETPAEQAVFLLDVVYRQLSERIVSPSANDSVVIGLPLALRLFEAIRYSKGVLENIVGSHVEEAAEIEQLRKINACFLGALNEIASGITPPDQNGHYLAHREAVRISRKAVRFTA